jgi:arylsulfatase A-like enzyme
MAEIEALSQRDDLNLLFIVVDTLRSDHLGHYGFHRDTSPFLDGLAENGAVFLDHFAQSSWTKSSMASLWTGLYPVHSGVTRALDGIPEEAIMPAEVLQDSGFVTAGIWRNGWVAPNFGFGQGFEEYHNPGINQAPRSLGATTREGSVIGSDLDVVYAAIEFLQVQRRQRFFLYLHMMDVHQYVSDQHSAIFGSRYEDSYDNAIRWTDSLLSLLVGKLDEFDLRDRTLIVLVSDHGEGFGEHGGEGHARTLYGEVTRTPFLIPFRLPEPIRVTEPSSNVDVWPTIFDLLGLAPAGEQGDGSSLLPELLGDNARFRSFETPIFLHHDRTWGQVNSPERDLVAVREGDHKLIRAKDSEGVGKLYDLSRDPAEEHDRATEEPEIAQRLNSRIDDYFKEEVFFEGGNPVVELDQMELNQLRALGYEIDQ